MGGVQYKKTDQTILTKVADFGLAAIKPKAKKTIRADPRGTPLTRAPEVRHGSASECLKANSMNAL